MKKHCTVVRVLAHTQISKVALKQKKAHMMEIQVGRLLSSLQACCHCRGRNSPEGHCLHLLLLLLGRGRASSPAPPRPPAWSSLLVQVNGGTTEEKVDFAYNLFEQSVGVEMVVSQNDMLDTIAITKGRGTEGRGHPLGRHPPAAQDAQGPAQGAARRTLERHVQALPQHSELAAPVLHVGGGGPAHARPRWALARRTAPGLQHA